MSMQDSPIKLDGFGALFDLSFTKVVTTSVIPVVYVLGMVMLCLAWLGFVIAAFSAGFLPGLFALVIGAVAVVVYLLVLRMWLELVVVIFRIGENTSAMARMSGVSTGGFPVTPLPPSP